MPPNDPLTTEPATDANFDAQRYLLACPDLADPYRDGLDPRAHFDAHGRHEGRHQLAAPGVPPERRSPGATLCAIARDEGAYLVEWIAYHRLIGFEHIVIYDNDSRDDSDALLDALAAAGLVEHRRWPDMPGRSAQLSAYADATVRCATRWIAFLDLDEFLELPRDATIGGFLARFDPDVAAIGINWRVFGSSGHADRDAGPVVERFTRAAPRGHAINRHIKTIAVAAEIYKLLAHRVRLMHGRYVDAAGGALDPGRGFADVRHERAQVNHYAVKSRAEFVEKRMRGCAMRLPGEPQKFTHRDGSYFDDHDRNEEADESILRHRAPLLLEIGRITALLTNGRIDPRISTGNDTNFLPR